MTHNLSNHGLFRTATGYELYRSLHHGLQGSAGSEYELIRTADDRMIGFDSQKAVKEYFDYKGETPEWTSSPDWNEIKNG